MNEEEGEGEGSREEEKEKMKENIAFICCIRFIAACNYFGILISTHHSAATGMLESVRMTAALCAYNPVSRYALAPYAWEIRVSRALHRPYAKEKPEETK